MISEKIKTAREKDIKMIKFLENGCLSIFNGVSYNLIISKISNFVLIKKEERLQFGKIKNEAKENNFKQLNKLKFNSMN